MLCLHLYTSLGTCLCTASTCIPYLWQVSTLLSWASVQAVHRLISVSIQPFFSMWHLTLPFQEWYHRVLCVIGDALAITSLRVAGTIHHIHVFCNCSSHLSLHSAKQHWRHATSIWWCGSATARWTNVHVVRYWIQDGIGPENFEMVKVADPEMEWKSTVVPTNRWVKCWDCIGMPMSGPPLLVPENQYNGTT